MKVEIYTVAIDGGTVGSHLMRGPFASDGEFYFLESIWILAPFTFNPGATIDFGTVSNPTLILSGYDLSFLSGTVPEMIYTNTATTSQSHVGAREPFLLTVNVADLLSGQLGMYLFAHRF